ncbi:MAG: hypothetical protein PVS3B1_00110 [Ktedonobacteraceae bacterium]
MSSIPRRLDKYELTERLGQGGAAEVWKAFDTQLQRYVAIKILHPDLREDPHFVARFQREAQLIASLHHPNIVQIHDFHVMQLPDSETGATLPLAYMVMDYVEGQTLAEYIHGTSNLGKVPSPAEIVGIFTSISLAIDYAHSKGMIHRDIKPANILLDHRNTARNAMGEPILTDFGIAKLMSSMTSTQSSLQLGTPLYISPEQARGELGSERSDLYSLGVILYEVVTGVLPFRGATPIDVIMQHVNATPIVPSLINPSVPQALATVIARSMAKDPAARYASASEMTIAIAEALNVPVTEVLKSASTSLPGEQPEADNFAASSLSGVQTIATQDTHIERPAAAFSTSISPAFSQRSTPYVQPPVFQGGGMPPASSASSASSSPARSNARRRTAYIVGAVVLIVALLGVGLAAFFYLPAQPPATSGQAFYVSSGQLGDGAQGIADEMQLDLKNVPAPQAGKSYHAWLLGDQDPVRRDDLLVPRPVKPPILLTNRLPVVNGAVHFLYPGDAQHNNLLSNTSRLLVTEEDAASTSNAPSPNHATWRYFAALPQVPIPGDSAGFNALIHIRHLFYNETDIKVLGLYGGLDIYVFRNTEKILEWSVSARDDWRGENTSDGQLNLIRNQFIRILDYLDGTLNRHVDIPDSVPFLADRQIARVSLLTVDPTRQSPPFFSQNPPGNIDHMQLHVGQVTKATDLTPEIRQHAQHILLALNDLGGKKGWLTDVHSDAVQLFNMSQNAVQLRQPEAGALLDDMVTKATYAYIGRLDPATDTVQPGVTQIHYDVQHLATLTLTSNVPDHL